MTIHADESKPPIALTQSNVLLVEGKDEQNFFKALLSHCHIENVQLLPLLGKHRLSEKLGAFVAMTGFSRVERYGIICDADDDANAAFQSIQYNLNRYSQPCPNASGEFTTSGRPLVGVFVLPDCSRIGMLEDVCLSTVENHPAMACVEGYIECLKSKLLPWDAKVEKRAGGAYFPKCLSKARARAFLAAMHEDVRNIGEAALKPYWDFDHSSLEPLRNFLACFA